MLKLDPYPGEPAALQAPSHPRRRHLGQPSLLLLGALALQACAKSQGAPKAGPPPASEVVVALLQPQPIAEVRRFTGRTAAVDYVELRARVNGTLDRVHFESGQLVERGAPLFTIDPRPYVANRDAAAAAVTEARVKVENSRLESERAEELSASKAVSAEELEGRKSGLAEAEAALASKQAALDLAELDLSFTTLTAPVSGRIGRALVTPGNSVSGMPGAGTLLATLVSIDPLHVYADLDEQSYLAFEAARAAGQLPLDADGRVRLKIDLIEGAGTALEASLESLDNRVEAGTGTLLLRALLPNPDGRLVPGLFARVHVPLSAPEPRLMLPESAIGTDQSQKFVYVVGADNTAQRRPVQLGTQVNGSRAVLSGLEPGDRVVVNGLSRIFFPGQPVVPIEAPAEAPKAASSAPSGS